MIRSFGGGSSGGSSHPTNATTDACLGRTLAEAGAILLHDGADPALPGADGSITWQDATDSGRVDVTTYRNYFVTLDPNAAVSLGPQSTPVGRVLLIIYLPVAVWQILVAGAPGSGQSQNGDVHPLSRDFSVADLPADYQGAGGGDSEAALTATVALLHRMRAFGGHRVAASRVAKRLSPRGSITASEVTALADANSSLISDEDGALALTDAGLVAARARASSRWALR